MQKESLFKNNDKQNGIIRVLQVTGGMNIGGAETMIMHLYRKIDKSKIQFDFISFTEAECHYDAEIKALGGNIFYTSPPKESNFLKFLANTYNIIKHNGPYRAVHAHTLFNSGLALLAAQMAGVKIRVCHSHALGYFSYTNKRNIYFALMRNLIKFCSNKNVACTEAAGRFLFGEGPKKQQNYRVLHNALDLAPYMTIKQSDVISLRGSLGINPYSLVIGHVGNFGMHKNHAFLIRLAEFLKSQGVDYKLILIGHGSLQEKIKVMVKEKGLNEYVKFLGLQTNIPLFMNMFDVFVFPSLHEGLGIVLIEAQAAGTPCVISDTIPAECDMELGLIRMMSLADRLEDWHQAIIGSCKNERLPPEITAQKIKQKGYNLDATVKTLIDIYG